MRYPFATFLVTCIVFAFLGLLIASGEYRLPLAESTIRHVNITRAALRCPDNALTNTSQAAIVAYMQSLCKESSSCAIDTVAMMNAVGIAVQPACTQELTLTYECVPLPSEQAPLPSIPHKVILYRGQIATLHCAEVPL